MLLKNKKNASGKRCYKGLKDGVNLESYTENVKL